MCLLRLPAVGCSMSASSCPSLLPEHKLHCSGDKMPPAIPSKHSRQRKVVEQWFLFFLLLMHVNATSVLLSAGCLPTLLLVQGLCLEPQWQWPFWYSTASPTLCMYPPYWWDCWGIVGVRTLQISTAKSGATCCDMRSDAHKNRRDMLRHAQRDAATCPATRPNLVNFCTKTSRTTKWPFFLQNLLKTNARCVFRGWSNGDSGEGRKNLRFLEPNFGWAAAGGGPWLQIVTPSAKTRDSTNAAFAKRGARAH